MDWKTAAIITGLGVVFFFSMLTLDNRVKEQIAEQGVRRVKIQEPFSIPGITRAMPCAEDEVYDWVDVPLFAECVNVEEFIEREMMRREIMRSEMMRSELEAYYRRYGLVP